MRAAKARAALNEARKNRAPKPSTETGQLAPARGIDDDLEKKDNKPCAALTPRYRSTP
jgi:hypothetical protein